MHVCVRVCVCQPVCFSAIKKKDGKVYAGFDEILSRWREHFEEVLNVISSLDRATLNAVGSLPLRCEFSKPPDKDEILRALGKLTLLME